MLFEGANKQQTAGAGASSGMMGIFNDPSKVMPLSKW